MKTKRTVRRSVALKVVPAGKEDQDQERHPRWNLEMGQDNIRGCEARLIKAQEDLAVTVAELARQGHGMQGLLDAQASLAQGISELVEARDYMVDAAFHMDRRQAAPVPSKAAAAVA